jgi:hypothetical protein
MVLAIMYCEMEIHVVDTLARYIFTELYTNFTFLFQVLLQLSQVNHAYNHPACNYRTKDQT